MKPRLLFSNRASLAGIVRARLRGKQWKHRLGEPAQDARDE